MPGRQAYLVPAAGQIAIDGNDLQARSGAMIVGADRISLTAREDSEILLADLPAA